MRQFIALILLLLFHLPGGVNAVVGNGDGNKILDAACSCLQKATLAAPAEDRQSQVQQPADLPVENNLFLFEEEDNEEEHSRKLKSSTEPVSLFSRAYTIAHRGTMLTNAPAFYSYRGYPVDCKYLAHCVLRI